MSHWTPSFVLVPTLYCGKETYTTITAKCIHRLFTMALGQSDSLTQPTDTHLLSWRGFILT